MNTQSDTDKKQKKVFHTFNRNVHPRISKAAMIFLVFIGLGAILLLLSFVQEPQDPQSQASQKIERFVKNEKKGLIWDDLREPQSDDSPCKSKDKDKKKDLLEVVDKKTNDVLGCTHGPDPAPEGVDIKVSAKPVDTNEDDKTASGLFPVAHAQTSPTANSIPCEGDGVSGKRVQVLYVRSSDKPDRSGTFAESFKVWTAKVDNIFNDSAAKTGGVSHMRLVTDSACNLSVPSVTLSSTGDDTFANTQTELKAQGYNRIDRKYMIFMDAAVYCGIANILQDTQPGSANRNNGGPSYARTDAGCWGMTNSAEAHELMHNLGGVQLSAPNTSTQWHCTDEYDRMCEQAALTYVCNNNNPGLERLFDCNQNDYFYSGTPPADNYLANNWNTANSSYLTGSVNLVALPDHPTDCEPGPNAAIIYTAANYTGTCKKLIFGYGYSQKTELYPFTGRVYSARVGENLKITICVSQNWASCYAPLTADSPQISMSAESVLVESRSGGTLPTSIPTQIPTPTTAAPDTTPPSIPTLTSVTASSSNLVNVAWSGSTDNVAVTGYRIYRSDKGLVPLVTVSATTYADTTVLPGKTYSYYLTAIDAAGNSSQFSNSLSVTTPVATSDITRPTVSITSPLNNGTVTRGRTVSINANASDNIGVTRVEFYVNGGLICTDTQAAYTCSWAVPGGRNVVYSLTAKAYDAANNQNTSSTVSVTGK